MRIRNYPLVCAFLATASVSLLPAHAAKTPRPLAADDRVKQVLYDPNQVYEIVGTYGYQTSVEFAADEKVKVVSLGDTIAWQTVPYQNRLFLKPVEPNAATNLTVLTDKRTYYFTLTSARKQAGMTFLVRFVYPGASVAVAASTQEPKRSVTLAEPSSRNSDYATSGDKTAIPLRRAYDDGQFTYFLFDQGAEIPSVYTVGPDGSESIVNTRREGHYLVVERMASLFTLRNGTAHLCVQNNALPRRPGDRLNLHKVGVS
ncbi:P-type conjugative transfer protein VirB9 (plasmid) [Comamonas antarctica]|uniref:P-type conjugative transfer protein VirB9 n=1 Tax=Comamonas antarctica TaxID=2743470 RepID=A0A6N1XAD4_9BURK|nr:P-type conjugative transfer protein VirB9 [Comamonas antarctica]QKV55688.1 P-type conjugative transfer protein VirB9 [Comamonas antarctica]